MTRPVTSSREVANLLEELERHPEALGYLKKFENAFPEAGPWKNPLWYRSQLEETILHHAGNGDGECLDMLLYAGITLTAFERYHELMATNRLGASVEDAFSGRRKSSRTGIVFNKCLNQLVDNGNHDLFEEKLTTLMSMGGRKLLSVPINAANVRPQDFHFARDVGESPEKLARFRFGVGRLLDSGMTNILGHLTRPIDQALLTGADRFREDGSREKEHRYNYWQDYLKALVLGHKPGSHKSLGELGIGACGAVFMTLRELITDNDLEGVRRLSGVYDLPGVYRTLAEAKPLKKDLSKTFQLERDEPLFTPISLLNLALPNGREGNASEDISRINDFSIFDLLAETGLDHYLAQPLHKAYFAANIGTNLENNPEVFDAVCQKAGLEELVEGLSGGALVGKTASYGYVCGSFYLKRLREAPEPEAYKIAMLSQLDKKSQERIFEAPGFMARLELTDGHRRYCSSDLVRSNMMAIDLGL